MGDSNLSCEIGPAQFFGPLKASRRSTRKSLSAAPTPRLEEKVTRKRTISSTTLQEKSEKKQRIESKKIVTHEQRDARDAARKSWLLRHRHIFEPLLPPQNAFFSGLAKEVAAANNQVTYTPLHEIDAQPSLITGGEMKDYQLHGLSFLAWLYHNGANGILGDEMGLGKTLQTLSLFAYIKETSKANHDPHLIICPLSVLQNWIDESSRWLPSFRTARFHGPKGERDRFKNSYRGDELPFDVCVTTYEAYSAEDTWFKSRRWTYVVLDEGHKIKNSGTSIAQRVQGIGCLYRLVLTGTPVQNNLVELWGLLHWLYPSVFTASSERLFQEAFDVSRGSYTIPFYNSTRDLLATIMLRRTKAVVEATVPPREELTVFIPLTEMQRFWTYRLLTRLDTVDLEEIFGPKVKHEGEAPVDDTEREIFTILENQNTPERTVGGRSGTSQWKRLMNLLMQLRQLCDHPYLLPSVEPEPYHLGEHVVAASSKLMAIDKLLAEVLPTGERVLIFSQWTGMLDLLEDHMALREIPYARLDGSTPRPRRAFDIKLFQQEKSPYQVYLISTKAGGLGINLTKATTVVMCDSDWNPQNDLQAIARAHRIGQKKTVKVYRLICRGSVEDQMLDRIRRKLFLSLRVMGSDRPSGNVGGTLGSAEVMDILRLGSSALTDTGLNLAEFRALSFADVCAASRQREEARAALEDHAPAADGDLEAEERRLLNGVAQVHSRLFEGRTVHRQDNRKIAKEWEELQGRARTERTVSVDGLSFAPEATPAPIITWADPVKTPKPVKKTAKFGWEDWCNYCSDGGELYMCSGCPRVFHADCHGASKAELKKGFITCAQHHCVGCNRNTVEAGGMLFRCQTCPRAFCEDCLPPGDINVVGETLPEFELLGYGARQSVYFIRCDDCLAHYAAHPKDREIWEAEVAKTAKALARLRAQA